MIAAAAVLLYGSAGVGVATQAHRDFWEWYARQDQTEPWPVRWRMRDRVYLLLVMSVIALIWPIYAVLMVQAWRERRQHRNHVHWCNPEHRIVP